MTLMNRFSVHALFIAALCGLVSISSGCPMFNSSLSKTDVAQTANQPAVPTYKVRVYGHGKPAEFVGKLDKNKTVQTALEESGVIDKFARMEITLAREVSGQAGRHKMPVAFDAATRIVSVSQDYAIHPNDVLVIRKDSSTAVDRVISKFTGGLGVAR